MWLEAWYVYFFNHSCKKMWYHVMFLSAETPDGFYCSLKAWEILPIDDYRKR
jgi:hypothetical protein